MTILRAGLRAERLFTVTEADTAIVLGSGDVAVLGTPRLLAWAEAATIAALDGALGSGETSVGARVELDHMAASPVGARVSARAELVVVEGRALVFDVDLFHDDGAMVGRGRVSRVVVSRDRFLARSRD
ncbi:MAG TPA: hotdog domain-containing protein [Jiangellaceae bacterium]